MAVEAAETAVVPLNTDSVSVSLGPRPWVPDPWDIVDFAELEAPDRWPRSHQPAGQHLLAI